MLFRFLGGRDELQNEPNLKSMRYHIDESLNVFEDSAQCEHTIVTNDNHHAFKTNYAGLTSLAGILVII